MSTKLRKYNLDIFCIYVYKWAIRKTKMSLYAKVYVTKKIPFFRIALLKFVITILKTFLSQLIFFSKKKSIK